MTSWLPASRGRTRRLHRDRREVEGQRVLFIFQGPHAYISPRWYADTARQVPTWNYVAAHVYGAIRLIQEGEELENIVTSLAARFEAGATTPWSLAHSDPANHARLRGIVGFELRSDSAQVKLKLNQNHPAANVAGAIAGLRATGSEEAAALAALMQQELERR